MNSIRWVNWSSWLFFVWFFWGGGGAGGITDCFGPESMLVFVEEGRLFLFLFFHNAAPHRNGCSALLLEFISGLWLPVCGTVPYTGSNSCTEEQWDSHLTAIVRPIRSCGTETFACQHWDSRKHWRLTGLVLLQSTCLAHQHIRLEDTEHLWPVNVYLIKKYNWLI